MPTKLLVVSLFCVSVLPSSSQSACLSGHVSNASGDLVAQVRVTLMAAETGTVRTLLSNQLGEYQACDLAAGEYRITVAAPGLSSDEQVVTLGAGSTHTLDLTLRETHVAGTAQNGVGEFRYSAKPDLPEAPAAPRQDASRPHGEAKAMWGSGLAGQSGLKFQEFPLAQFDAAVGGDLVNDRTSYFVRYDSLGVDSQSLLNALAAAQARAAKPIFGVAPTLVTSTSFDARLDHHFNSRDTFSTRFSHSDIGTSLVVPAHGGESQSLAQRRHISQTAISADNTFDLSANTTNESRVQFTSTESQLPAGAQQAGVITGLPTAHRDRVFEAASNIYRQVGGESLKFGGDFLLNQMNLTFLETTAQSTLSQSSHNTGLYVMSERQVHPNLTLTSGMRYEVAPLSGFKTDRNNLNPQVGFAWAPASRTVLRGGGGIYYDQGPLPAQAASADASTAANLNRSASLSGQVPPATLFAAFNPAIQRTYAETANLGAEQQLSAHTSLSADYVFARGLQIATPVFESAALCCAAPGCRTSSSFRAAESGSGAESSYAGMSVAFTQEPVRWGNYRIAYTYATADSGGLLGNGSYLTDTLRRVSFTSVLHTSPEPALDIWQRFTRGFVLSTSGDYSNRSEFTGINFLNLDARLTKTLAWGQHYRLDALAESFNSFERDSVPMLKSIEGMGDRFVNVYSTYRAVASLQGPTAAQFGFRLGF